MVLKNVHTESCILAYEDIYRVFKKSLCFEKLGVFKQSPHN
jgi:hypothetical protein